MTTSKMKYKHAQVPVVRIPSYITAFQSSPVSTWKIVTNAQKMSSKLWTGWSDSPSLARYVGADASYAAHGPIAPVFSLKTTHWFACAAEHGA